MRQTPPLQNLKVLLPFEGISVCGSLSVFGSRPSIRDFSFVLFFSCFIRFFFLLFSSCRFLLSLFPGRRSYGDLFPFLKLDIVMNSGQIMTVITETSESIN